MLNNCINYNKVVTYGLDIDDDTIIFTNTNKNLVSPNKEILCYVYFKDIVDIRYIEINTRKTQNATIKLWNYNMDVDFDTLYPNIEKTISTNTKHHIDNKYFDLQTDYFTIIISNIKNIYNITFYGRYHKYDTRRLESIRIGGRNDGGCKDISNSVGVNTPMSSKV